MDLQTAMSVLERLGSEQTRKTWRRHGVGENMYGVKYGDLNKLKKQIKTDHTLALGLWATGNHDARILATMIADPKQMTEETLDAWLADLDNYIQTDAVVNVAAQLPNAQAKTEEWLASEDEYVARAGWHLLGQLALNHTQLPDAYFEPYLARIRRDIHQAKNRTREAMNNALIAIGSRNTTLAPITLECAAQIGKVHIDHGQTCCKTPDAVEYIQKTLARKSERAKVMA